MDGSYKHMNTCLLDTSKQLNEVTIWLLHKQKHDWYKYMHYFLIPSYWWNTFCNDCLRKDRFLLRLVSKIILLIIETIYFLKDGFTSISLCQVPSLNFYVKYLSIFFDSFLSRSFQMIRLQSCKELHPFHRC